MRSFAMTTFALALAFAPAAAFAQQQPPAQPPAGQPPAAAQPAAPAPPKLTFTTPVGMLFVYVKPDQTATFEEMMDKLKTGVAASSDPALKAQAGAWHYYRTAEPGPPVKDVAPNGTVVYIILIDPAKPGDEYQFLEVIAKTLTDDQKRDPKTGEMYTKFAGSIAQMSKMNLTPKGQ
jgi:hypothetical protein